MGPAPKPLVITISHQLGRNEAKRRLDDGLGKIRPTLAAFTSAVDYRWTEYRLDFGVTAMLHRIVGHIDVEDDLLRVELGLPALLQLLSRTISRRITAEGSRLLGKPKG